MNKPIKNRYSQNTINKVIDDSNAFVLLRMYALAMRRRQRITMPT